MRWGRGFVLAIIVDVTISSSLIIVAYLHQIGIDHVQQTTTTIAVKKSHANTATTIDNKRKELDMPIERRLLISLESLACIKQDKDPITMLLIGTDARHDEAARADTMLLTRVDLSKHKALIVSIPRDMRVVVPGYGYTKINHALAYGDIPLLKRTIKQTFDIQIDHAVVVDFMGFSRLIDAVGGVRILIDHPLNYDDNTDNTHIHLPSGLQHLNGKSALDYVRFRHDRMADTGRMQRQRKLLYALASTSIPIERWWSVGTAIPELTRHIHSDMSQIDLLSEVAKVSLSPKWTITTELLHGVNRVNPVDDLWYFYVNKDAQWENIQAAFTAKKL